MNKVLPPLFIERLRAVVPAQHFEAVRKSFASMPCLSIRVNTLKIGRSDFLVKMKAQRVLFKEVPWNPGAFVFEQMTPEVLGQMDMITQGAAYRQSLSSMVPAIVLGPEPAERILDLCAAPGSKTTQMAAMMNNEGEIVAVEAIRQRFYKLRSVVGQMGAGHVTLKLMDGRRFRSDELFDRILVDAPCSSEGRFLEGRPKTYAYWSLRKIKEMVRKQRGLLLTASRLLKPGGVMVYSTCTFAPEENEGVADWVLRKAQGALETEAVGINGIADYPCLGEWQGKVFDPRVRRCLRILPGNGMEGFFIAKFVKLK